jgi:hypothetical protein
MSEELLVGDGWGWGWRQLPDLEDWKFDEAPKERDRTYARRYFSRVHYVDEMVGRKIPQESLSS